MLAIRRSEAVYTTDPDNDDVWCMVVSQGMFNQSSKMYQDSLGRPYLQRSDVYGLCYATSTSKIYNMCKVRQVDRNGDRVFHGDRCFTIIKDFERLEAEIGISRGQGLHECELKDGQLIYLAVIYMADTLQNLPRPAARIQKSKDFLNTRTEPIMYCE
ncbi:hypothetical protein GGF50DRAFT_116522 [Schizophyllum commune]